MNISVNNKTLSDVLVLPIDGLSANAQEIIREVSEVYQCSRDIVLAAMFSAVGVAVGGGKAQLGHQVDRAVAVGSGDAEVVDTKRYLFL